MAVHAEDPDRKEKVLKLRHEEVPGLLTTTILERGITIKNVQVAVIGAESTIFTSSALIQIAGRVGRNADFSGGDVVFFHHGITIEMDDARTKILYYNKKGFSQ
nr:helicase-related protein [Lysinibacillus xylanilyticus]